MKTVLLVGGSRGGQTVTVNNDLRELRMLPLETSARAWESVRMRTADKGPHEIYVSQHIHDRQKDIEVFCLAGINLIEELLKGYQPPTGN